VKRRPHTPLARNLRASMTDAEIVLWRHLRSDRFFGLKFRRQETIGSWIVDFCCHERSLVVELDGGQHCTEQVRDQDRTQDLQQRGYRVLRFWNNEVLVNTEAVLEHIRNNLNLPSPNPSPASGRGNSLKPITTEPMSAPVSGVPLPLGGRGVGEGGPL
jgi:very-short-patch-repair endonuclease